MQKSRLFHLFHQLDTWEARQLRQFLESPFFNRRTDVVSLLDFMASEKSKARPDFSRQNAFAAVFPGKAYDEQAMYLLMSYLSKLLEQFLAFREVSKDHLALQRYLTKAFRKANNMEDFSRALDTAKKMNEKQPLRDGQYLRQVYELELEHYNYTGSRSRSTENNLQTLSDTFDTMYIAEKLRQFCLLVSHQAVFKKAYETAMSQAVFAMLDEQPALMDSPPVGIYFHCYKAITTGEEPYFQKLRELMALHAERFAPSELRDIHLLAINFCIKRMNTGGETYIREGFELYKAGLERGLLLENGEVSHFTFNNAVLLGIKLKQFGWVEEFIGAYTQKLPAAFRQSVSRYSLAVLRYEQNRYGEAMHLLVTFDSSDHLMNLGAKFILLKIYYEQQEFDALYSLLESMRAYLQRKEVMGYHKDHYADIIRLTKKMLASDGSTKAKANLREQAAALKVESAKEWFFMRIG